MYVNRFGDSCSSYMACVGFGFGHVAQCAAGTSFNPETLKCEEFNCNTATQRDISPEISSVVAKQSDTSATASTSMTAASSSPSAKRLVLYVSSQKISYEQCRSFDMSALSADVASHVIFSYLHIRPPQAASTQPRVQQTLPNGPESSEYTLSFARSEDIDALRQLQVVKQAHPDLKVLIAVGGYTFSQDSRTSGIFPSLAADGARLQAFAVHALNFVEQLGMDGLSLDWEFPGAAQKNAFTSIVRALRSEIDAKAAAGGKTLLLTFSAPSDGVLAGGYDLNTVTPLVDFINLMTYSYHGAWVGEKKLQFHSPMLDCNSAGGDIMSTLKWYQAQGVPAAKLNMGVATYGQTYKFDPAAATAAQPGSDALLRMTSFNQATPEPGVGGACTRHPGMLAYFEIVHLVDATKVQYDQTAMAAYATYDQTNWVTFDDATSFQMKVCAARREGVGGLAVWTATLDNQLEMTKGLRGQLSQGFAALCEQAGAYQAASCN